MNKLSGLLLAVLLLVVANAWGGCTSGSFTLDYWRDVSGLGTETKCGGDNTCTYYGTKICDTAVEPTDSRYLGCKIKEYRIGSSVWTCPHTNSNCTACDYNVNVAKIVCDTYCDTQCDVDSLNCSNAGGTWTNTGASTCNGKSCKMPNCRQSDSTWLSASIAACTGSNNYALVDTDSTCEHVGTCCPNDSIPSGNTCKWRCDSVLTTCNNRTGDLFGGVLPDTSVSGQDTTFSYQCYYNCSHSPNPDSTVYLVEGNIVLSGPSDSIPDGIKSETFNSVRTTTGGVYVYDYLSPAASEYVDSIAAMKCVEHLWRCVVNNKYVYWYDNQEVPAGCTNIVRVK